MALEIGETLDGKYKILSLLGEGGMGAVYAGENTRIHRRVAIKVLHGDLAKNQEAVIRFEREAQAAGRIGSNHIVEVLDLGELPGGARFMVMEFLEGETLSLRLSRGPVTAENVSRLMIGVLEGLSAAHAAGIVHRDLKPDNIFLLSGMGAKRDFVKIVDFGISKFSALGQEFSMTRTGAVMGTPYYMAPEQAKGGGAIDHRVDLYAVGVILYQAVVGRVPFDAETFNELVFKIVLETPPALGGLVQDIDPDFVAIVSRAMSRAAGCRYQSADEFKCALQAWMANGSKTAPTIHKKTIGGGTPSVQAGLLTSKSELGWTASSAGASTQLCANSENRQESPTLASWQPVVSRWPLKRRFNSRLWGGLALAVFLVTLSTLVLIERSKQVEDAAVEAALNQAQQRREVTAAAKKRRGAIEQVGAKRTIVDEGETGGETAGEATRALTEDDRTEFVKQQRAAEAARVKKASDRPVQRAARSAQKARAAPSSKATSPQAHQPPSVTEQEVSKPVEPQKSREIAPLRSRIGRPIRIDL